METANTLLIVADIAGEEKTFRYAGDQEINKGMNVWARMKATRTEPEDGYVIFSARLYDRDGDRRLDSIPDRDQ